MADLVDNDNVDGVTGSEVAGFFGVEPLLHSPLDLSLVGVLLGVLLAESPFGVVTSCFSGVFLGLTAV